MKSVFLFGDSVFFGVGASSRDRGCGKLLKKNINMPVFIKSRSLETSRDGLQRLERDILSKADSGSFIVIMFGNNDCRFNEENIPLVGLEEYRNNLKEMIRTIKFSSNIPFLCNLQPMSSDGFFRMFPNMRVFENDYLAPDLWQKKYSDACGDIVREEKITLIDVRTALEKHKDLVFAEDGLHPNDSGHEVVALEIANVLKKWE